MACRDDRDIMAALAHELWPSSDAVALRYEMEGLLASEGACVFLAFDEDVPTGFAQCQLRVDYVEGTNSSPVGYLEGVYVRPAFRRRGVAGRLVAECEIWARARGCTEFGSDCELGNEASRAFHRACGFSEANRVICFAKRL